MTPDHPYYQTAKRIFQYCKHKKDREGEEFPILGTCQGFQVLALIASQDNFKIMEKIFVAGDRKVIWKGNTSKLFQGFSDTLKDKMAKKNLTYHYHEYSITTGSFEKIKD